MSFYTLPALTVAFTAVSCAGVGFLDDMIKLTHRRSLGLSGRWKMLLLAGITVVVGIAAHRQDLRHDVFIPIVNYWLPLPDKEKHPVIKDSGVSVVLLGKTKEEDTSQAPPVFSSRIRSIVGWGTKACDTRSSWIACSISSASARRTNTLQPP